MELSDLGFNDWFQGKLPEYQPQEYRLARVTTVNKDNYLVRNEHREITAEITGKIMFGAASNYDFPVVGDWVLVQYYDDHTYAIIYDILPRKTILKRKIAGRDVDYQLIAANIDTAFIIQSCDVDYNLRRLERYLVMVHESHIPPVILLSKCDLIDPKDLANQVTEIKKLYQDYKIVTFSNETSIGIDQVQALIMPGLTYCLLGSSGVGKTTLINRLIGQDLLATGSVRDKNGKGRHVTARRQLLVLEQGGLVIDTPGMRELGNFGVTAGLDETFTDIHELSQQCRFKDCTHLKEPGCMVLDAVEKGTISEDYYHSYLKLTKESQYYERTYLEKRKRDKKFGKMIKEVTKNNKKR